jgi:hypothetical protein
VNSADVFRIDFFRTLIQSLDNCGQIPQLVNFEVFHSSANHARFHGAEIVDVNLNCLPGWHRSIMKHFCKNFEHVHCFYSFATRIVRETRAVVSLVYNSLLKRTTTYLQQWSSRLHWLGTCAGSFPHSCTHTETCFNTFKQVPTWITVCNKAELLFSSS